MAPPAGMSTMTMKAIAFVLLKGASSVHEMLRYESIVRASGSVKFP
jgi:hypothetical protein